MENNNFFNEMMKMQKSIFESQNEAYSNFMKAFKMDNFKGFMPDTYVGNFKNPMDFLKNYNEATKKFEDMFKEFFEKTPGYEDTMKIYNKNIDFINKLYLAYMDFYNDLDLVNAQNKLLDLFEIYSEELYEVSKKYFYKLVPDKFYEVIENFNLEKFVKPAIENSKKSLYFYEEALKNRPEILIADVKDFYENILDKMYEVPSIGVDEEEKRKSKMEMKKYLELELKLLEFGIFLEKKNNETALKAQKAYLEGLENEAAIEDFSDFYRFYIKNFEKAYKELVNSEEYKEEAKEIIKLVNENNEIYKNRIEEKFENLPIFTTKAGEKLQDELADAKKKNEELAKEVEAVKKELRDLKKEMQNK